MNQKDLFYLMIPLVRTLLTFKSPTDKLLSGFFRQNKKLTSNDRTLIADTIYTILRNYYKITQLVNDHVPNIIGITWLKLLNLLPSYLPKTMDSGYFTGLKFGDDELSRLELPHWILEQLHLSYSNNEVELIAHSLQQSAALDLRVNLIKNDLESVMAELKEFAPHKMEFSTSGIRIDDKTFLARHKLFLDGSIEVQDESSQLAGLLLNPRRGEMVVDFCAGAGGKTLLLGMLMKNSGRIYAFDVNEKRLNNLSPRMIRSGLSNIHPQLINDENDSKIKRLHGKIDKVFVDAPCSGLGTLRRNPELKFRQTPAGIAELNLKQLSILEAAGKLLKPGGHLVYATCSILFQENQNIVNQFLASHPEFRLIPAATVLDNLKLTRDDGCLVLLPNIHHTDGFFAALLQRIN